MDYLEVKEKKNFVGRETEFTLLDEIKSQKQASILVLYGRRRIGKTELAEQGFRDNRILKFEGVEGQGPEFQMQAVLSQLYKYTHNRVLRSVSPRSWTEIFELIWDCVSEGEWTLYFEELQWLATYQSQFISELKYAWDNSFSKNPKLIMILCGSSPSFMIKKVLHSNALYNRSQYELALQPFTIDETAQFLKGKSKREIMDAYLTIGGIPEYLKRIKGQSSVFLSLCKESFRRGGFFANEFKRIFTSSFADERQYEMIIRFLSKRQFATRNEISAHLGLKSGGTVTAMLDDLEICGFITRYTPYNASKSSLLGRYTIVDNYLQFYFKFIEPVSSDIITGQYEGEETRAIKMQVYQQWLGYSFERYIRANHRRIAKLLGFDAVNYTVGAFFDRKTTAETPGFQIDLVFDRADNVLSVCEIKYLQVPVSSRVIREMESKIELWGPPPRKTIHRVLISAEGADQGLVNRAYFDRVLCLGDLFGV